MSLQSDIEQAFLNSMHGGSVDVDSLSNEEKGNVPILSEGLAIAITEWLKRQIFRIQDMRAYVEIDQIKTTGAIQADVKESTIMGQYAPIIDALEKAGGAVNSITPGVGDPILEPISKMKKVAKVISKDGATVPPVDMNKDGGQGGTLIATGHAYIGVPAEGKPGADTADVENDYATIRMIDGEEVD